MLTTNRRVRRTRWFWQMAKLAHDGHPFFAGRLLIRARGSFTITPETMERVHPKSHGYFISWLEGVRP